MVDACIGVEPVVSSGTEQPLSSGPHRRRRKKEDAARKEKGGCGGSPLKTHNEALLLQLKYLHKLFNQADITWVQLIWEKHYPNEKLWSHVKKESFWWKYALKLLGKYKEIASVHINDGSYTPWSGHENYS